MQVIKLTFKDWEIKRKLLYHRIVS